MSNPEKRTVKLLEQALYEGAPFDVSEEQESPAKIKAWGLGVLRGFFFYDYCCQLLVKKGTDRATKAFLMHAMFRLDDRPSETALLTNTLVESAKKMHISGSFVNAVLRNYIIKRQGLEVKARGRGEIQYNMRASLLDRIKTQQEKWREIIRYMQSQPRLVLRVNLEKTSETTFIQALEQEGVVFECHDKVVVIKEGVAVKQLPGYAQGWFTVISESNQKALSLLPSLKSPKILDACAAPGGKSFLLREKYGRGASILATDVDSRRLARLIENDKRMGLNIDIIEKDWTKEQGDEKFDLVWADVPCSATGVIGKHPEIAVYDRDDLQNTTLQQEIMRSLWKRVQPGGYLIYTTCSILEEENSDQVQEFLRDHLDASVMPGEASEMIVSALGGYLTSDNSRDIIYFCKIKKSDK